MINFPNFESPPSYSISHFPPQPASPPSTVVNVRIETTISNSFDSPRNESERHLGDDCYFCCIERNASSAKAAAVYSASYDPTLCYASPFTPEGEDPFFLRQRSWFYSSSTLANKRPRDEEEQRFDKPPAKKIQFTFDQAGVPIEMTSSIFISQQPEFVPRVPEEMMNCFSVEHPIRLTNHGDFKQLKTVIDFSSKVLRITEGRKCDDCQEWFFPIKRKRSENALLCSACTPKPRRRPPKK